MKQLFAAVFFLVIGGGLFYWYQTQGSVVDEGELTIAMPRQYMAALRESPQSLDDVVSLLGDANPDDVRRSLDLMIEAGKVRLTDDGLYVAASK